MNMNDHSSLKLHKMPTIISLFSNFRCHNLLQFNFSPPTCVCTHICVCVMSNHRYPVVSPNVHFFIIVYRLLFKHDFSISFSGLLYQQLLRLFLIIFSRSKKSTSYLVLWLMLSIVSHIIFATLLSTNWFPVVNVTHLLLRAFSFESNF